MPHQDVGQPGAQAGPGPVAEGAHVRFQEEGGDLVQDHEGAHQGVHLLGEPGRQEPPQVEGDLDVEERPGPWDGEESQTQQEGPTPAQGHADASFQEPAAPSVRDGPLGSLSRGNKRPAAGAATGGPGSSGGRRPGPALTLRGAPW